MVKPIIDPNKSYTFRSYYFLPFEAREIAGYFGFELSKGYLELPEGDRFNLEVIQGIENKLRLILPLTELSSETARREILISPLLLELVSYRRIQFSIEYTLNVSKQLKGSLDYYLRNDTSNFLIIEAKLADMTRGFKQLMAEMIALSQWLANDKIIYGAVSIGDIWQFAVLDPVVKKIDQDLTLYRVPDDLDGLFAILLGIFE